MQKTIKALAIGLLALSAQHLSAHTNKTFLATRPDGANSLLERVTLQSMTSSKAEDSFGGTFQATAFYNESLKSDDLARYFYFKDKSGSVLTRDNLRSFISDHNGGPGANQPLAEAGETTVKLNPTIRSYGLMMTYYQDLEKILPGLYFDIRVPIVQVETDLGAIITGGNSDTVKKYVSGSLDEIAKTAIYAREPLRNARFGGKRQAIGIADIDLRMGYTFLQKSCGSLGFNLGLTVPTGNQSNSKYAFDALYGNGNHWGFGAGVEGRYELLQKENSNLSIHGHVDYRQLFTNTERRTLGIKGLDLGQYRIVAEKGNSSHNLQAIPAANILTQNVDITPGMQLDNVIGFTYNYGGISIDLGYNLYYKDRESLKLRDEWNSGKYVYLTNDPAALAVEFGSGAPGGTDFTAVPLAPSAANLTTEALDVDAARTPVTITNKLLGGVGYIFNEWEYPLLLSVGGSYDIPADNSSVRAWGFFFKTAIAF